MTRTFFLSLREAAKRLKKTQKELRSMAKDERLQDYRDGSKVFFRAGDVEALAGRKDSSKQAKTGANRSPRRPAKCS